MRVDLFDYHLPEELIATSPATPRDAARLMVVDGPSRQHLNVHNLPDLLQPGDVMVFNDSRVIPARIFTENNVECLLHQHMGGNRWRVFAKPGRKLKPGQPVAFGHNLTADVLEKQDDGQVILSFSLDHTQLMAWLTRHGQMPLPPYIQKKRAADSTDQQSYQTIYAKHDGSVAAPTAGLHFTPDLLAKLDAKNIQRHFVTLHVGAGTFQPVKVDDTNEHVMHEEIIQMDESTATALNQAKTEGRRIIVVGTTALRTLESIADDNGRFAPFTGPTGIFITPGYNFKSADMLMTNFHLPKSTLMMLVCAFAGMEEMHAAYAEAIAKHYRFYSYGDSSLLMRKA
ncbi:tRNA preQ1(34) S-adenosylmethionine ribosyltransferase-isomerase QueA [bacterium]|nr:tRNA preQ1(34) S-adenosylmethionine ribosyltransferase-isomerase QueA [bacterium]